MTCEWTVSWGQTSIIVRHSALLLGDDAPGSRIVGDAEVVAATHGGKAAADRATMPAIDVFSIPSHILEEFWLNDVSRLATSGAGQAGSEPLQSFSDIGYLLETLDALLAPPFTILFDITTGDEFALAQAGAPVWAGALGRSGSITVGTPRVCALLNLDDTSQYSRLGATDSQPARQIPVQFRLGPGEGAVWRTSQINILDQPPTLGQVRHRLIILYE